MKRNNLKNKFKNQKGITVADVTISLLIILTTLGVITMVYVNLVVASRETDRKAGATRIATNIMENLSSLYFDEIEVVLKNSSAKVNGSVYHINDSREVKKLNTTIPNGYNVVVSVSDVNNVGIVKKIEVNVDFAVDGVKENVKLEKVFEREQVRECNSPNFTEESIKLIIPDKNWQLWSDKSKDMQSGEKILCPVYYDVESKKYKLLSKNSIDQKKVWYSYSNKEWARILVFEKDQYIAYVDFSDINNVYLKDNSVLTDQRYSYVWIPRYGVLAGKDLSNGVNFKYKKTDIAIQNSYYDNQVNLIQNVLNKNADWKINQTSFDSNHEPGRWYNYSDLTNTSTDAYKLNHSQFGPMFEH